MRHIQGRTLKIIFGVTPPTPSLTPLQRRETEICMGEMYRRVSAKSLSFMTIQPSYPSDGPASWRHEPKPLGFEDAAPLQ